MTRQEVVALLQRINAYYPNQQTPMMAAQDWDSDLAECSREDVDRAWERWRSTAGSPYPPRANDLWSLVIEARPAISEEDRYQAWLRRTPNAGRFRPS
jgi:hypothetical protein